MGAPDSSLLDLIQKIKSWISWGNSGLKSMDSVVETKDNNTCCSCEIFLSKSYHKYHCQSCGNMFCGNCVEGLASLDGAVSNVTSQALFTIKQCKICRERGSLNRNVQRNCVKVHPSDSPGISQEPSSPPSFSVETLNGDSPHATTSSDVSFANHLSPLSVHRSRSRSDGDEGIDSSSHFFTVPNEYFHDTCDLDSISVSTGHEFNSFISVNSSPLESPSRIHITSNRVGQYVQQEQTKACNNHNKEQAVLVKPATLISDPEKSLIFHSNFQFQHPPLDFETNGLIWFPPPPADVNDEADNNFFAYNDEDDDDDNILNSDIVRNSSSSGIDSVSLVKEKQNLDQKESLRASVQGHFRALVLQLLKGQGMVSIEDKSGENWLDVITSVSWQAANYIKPDTSGGGSMDPCEYVKIKCVASGNPSDSKLVRGVVCTKNLKHKRMMSQYKNTRLLLLGGALEYQRVPNQLASFETLLQQEKDHLKTVVSRIEAHRPNVLLVEKSVSSIALEHLLAKEISLVLNVKRPLLEQIARCTGATITPSTDHISKTRLGHCEVFHLDKVSEEHEPLNQLNKKPSKTLMFFEGCPRRLGCTVVLHGSCREELKKVKNVVQYAVFTAYHLSLETSFLTDEGASLPTISSNSSHMNPEKSTFDDSELATDSTAEITVPNIDITSSDLSLELGLQESFSELGFADQDDVTTLDEFRYRKAFYEACDENLALDATLDLTQDEGQLVPKLSSSQNKDEPETTTANEYYMTNDTQQSILVSYSSHCIVNGTLCERSRLLRVKFYGPSDKPLGRFLRDDLFDQSYICQSCKESAEAHVTCYTHQNGNLTINVKRLPSIKHPGERDGKIWMWHRCLKCAYSEGVPPATQRVVMSDAAWGLSFGKFLELSFSTHATGNRVASCGHSLQRDCLRFYGFGNMVAFFRYSPVNILTVHLPPSILEFGNPGEEIWIRKEADELLTKAEALYAELSNILEEIKSKSLSCLDEFSDASELHDHVLELYNLLFDEKKHYQDMLKLSDQEQEISGHEREDIDILEINRLRHSLLIATNVWDRRLYLLSSLLKRSSTPKIPNDAQSLSGSTHSDLYSSDHHELEEPSSLDPNLEEGTVSPTCLNREGNDETFQNEATLENTTSLERLPSEASILSDKIDSAWSGVDPNLTNPHAIDRLNSVASENLSFEQMNRKENPSVRRLLSPTRVYSFDSAQRIQDRIKKGLPPSSLHLSNLRSFHASGDYRYMVRDPVPRVHRSFSQVPRPEAERLNLSSNAFPSLISSSASLLPEGARLMIPQNSSQEIVITVYDNEPTGIISYALSSKEYEDYIADRPSGGSSNVRVIGKMNSVASDLSSWQSFGSMDSDFTNNYGNYYSSEDALSNTVGSSLPSDPPSTSSPRLRISFEDDSSKVSGKVKFSVVCYFAKQFDALRRRCCPDEVDFLRSLGRCRRWNAQGGKSNVYFAKSFDERFIIKQMTKTELESFEEFAPEYFKYLTDALVSGSPTCLAKILGIYQVVVKHPKGGKEVKMDLMIMENLFYKRNISKIYDLKGSERSRYVSDKMGSSSKVLLDMNLLETLRTNPMFLGSKSKRILERAVWNDTSFLASIDVMDYSLLVGVDEERNELVMGIIDFMRQYTWDKHLETWVKASGILGGPKNASPTIVSPKQYKKRFRKAMTAYFLTVPDQWTS